MHSYSILSSPKPHKKPTLCFQSIQIQILCLKWTLKAITVSLPANKHDRKKKKVIYFQLKSNLRHILAEFFKSRWQNLGVHGCWTRCVVVSISICQTYWHVQVAEFAAPLSRPGPECWSPKGAACSPWHAMHSVPPWNNFQIGAALHRRSELTPSEALSDSNQCPKYVKIFTGKIL